MSLDIPRMATAGAASLLLGAGLVGLVGLQSAAASSSVTLYASPTGSSADCTAKSPCSVSYAVESAPNDSTVIVEPGTYGSPSNGLTEPLETDVGVTDVTIEGQPGKSAPVIYSRASFGIELYEGGLAHLVLHYSGAGAALLTTYASVDHVLVDSAASDACRIHNSDIQDSVCWARATNGQAADGLSDDIQSGNDNSELSDDTIVSGLGNGARFHTSGSATETISISNSIMSGVNGSVGGFDVVVDADDTSSDTVSVRFSDYGSFAGGEDATATSNFEHDDSDLESEPVFAHAGTSLREAASSPTVDAGAKQLATGTTDLAGLPRDLGSAVDMGAYEFPPAPKARAPIVTHRGRHSLALHLETVTGGLDGSVRVIAEARHHSASSHTRHFAAAKQDSTKDLTVVVHGLHRHQRYRLEAVVRTAGGKVLSKHVTAKTS